MPFNPYLNMYSMISPVCMFTAIHLPAIQIYPVIEHCHYLRKKPLCPLVITPSPQPNFQEAISSTSSFSFPILNGSNEWNPNLWSFITGISALHSNSIHMVGSMHQNPIPFCCSSWIQFSYSNWHLVSTICSHYKQSRYEHSHPHTLSCRQFLYACVPSSDVADQCGTFLDQLAVPVLFQSLLLACK